MQPRECVCYFPAGGSTTELKLDRLKLTGQQQCTYIFKKVIIYSTLLKKLKMSRIKIELLAGIFLKHYQGKRGDADCMVRVLLDEDWHVKHVRDSLIVAEVEVVVVVVGRWT